MFSIEKISLFFPPLQKSFRKISKPLTTEMDSAAKGILFTEVYRGYMLRPSTRKANIPRQNAEYHRAASPLAIRQIELKKAPANSRIIKIILFDAK